MLLVLACLDALHPPLYAQVRGTLNTVTGHVDSLLNLGTGSSDFRQRSSRRVRRGEKPLFEFAKPELRLGGAYVPGKDELMYGLTAKQKAFIGPFGLKAKAAVTYPMRSQQVLPGTYHFLNASL